MKKLIGIAAVALLAAGCSGSNNGSSGSSTSTTTGTTSHTTTTGGNNTNTTTGTNGSASNTTGTTGGSNTTTGTTGASNTTTGTNGTNGTGGTSGGDNVTGTLGFTVGKVIGFEFFQYPDGGGQDNTRAEIDLTDDATDTCDDDYALPDGGVPAAEHYYMAITANDPNGVTLGTAYQALSVGQWNNALADGGGAPTTNLQAVYYNIDTSDVYVAVNGTATFNQDSQQNPTVSFSLTMGKANTTVKPPTVSAAGTSTLTGQGTAACGIGLIEQ